MPAMVLEMGKVGLDCFQCHRTKDHQISGRSMSVSVEDAHGVSCTDRHASAPHKSERLNARTTRPSSPLRPR